MGSCELIMQHKQDTKMNIHGFIFSGEPSELVSYPIWCLLKHRIVAHTCVMASVHMSHPWYTPHGHSTSVTAIVHASCHPYMGPSPCPHIPRPCPCTCPCISPYAACIYTMHSLTSRVCLEYACMPTAWKECMPTHTLAECLWMQAVCMYVSA